MVWHYPSHLHPGNKDSEQHQYQLTMVPLKKKKTSSAIRIVIGNRFKNNRDSKLEHDSTSLILWTRKKPQEVAC